MSFVNVRKHVRIGQAVHMESNIPSQRNGVIRSVLWDDDEVIVIFNDMPTPQSITFDQLEEGGWTDNFGGMWMLP